MKSPGQVLFELYRQAQRELGREVDTWNDISEDEQSVWELFSASVRIIE